MSAFTTVLCIAFLNRPRIISSVVAVVVATALLFLTISATLLENSDSDFIIALIIKEKFKLSFLKHTKSPGNQYLMWKKYEYKKNCKSFEN